MNADNVTSQTRKVVERWENASRTLARAESELNSAKCELDNAANAAGKFLTPDDAKTNEVFHIWFGNGLLAISVISDNTYRIAWRKRATGI